MNWYNIVDQILCNTTGNLGFNKQSRADQYSKSGLDLKANNLDSEHDLIILIPKITVALNQSFESLTVRKISPLLRNV